MNVSRPEPRSRPPAAGAPEPSALRREPYRLFFPLGVALAFGGILHFPVSSATHAPEPRILFHSVALVQGFVTSFAAGFLFTFIPRRTLTPPPPAWLLVLAAAGPVLATTLAAFGRLAEAQAAWLVALAALAGFAARRFRAPEAPRRLPGVFAWVPVSLAMAVLGAASVALSWRLPPQHGMLAWAIGRGVVLQGLVTGLVVGVGTILLPQLTRGEAPADALLAARSRRGWALHALLALLFFASFPLELLVEVRSALALRAAVPAAVLLFAGRIHRPPTVPGLHRAVAWSAAWMLAGGYALLALLPGWRGAMLHVTFVGGFALLTLAIGLHVLLSHSGRPAALSGAPPAVRVLAALGAAAVTLRLLAGIDRDRLELWTGLAALAFAGALAAWVAAAWPRRTAPLRR